jgi:hypothetical protein
LAARVVSRYGDISPAFADAYGASVDFGLSFGSRSAAARALSASARVAHGSARVASLPVEIPTVRSLPPSRINAAVNPAPKR